MFASQFCLPIYSIRKISARGPETGVSIDFEPLYPELLKVSEEVRLPWGAPAPGVPRYSGLSVIEPWGILSRRSQGDAVWGRALMRHRDQEHGRPSAEEARRRDALTEQRLVKMRD